MAEKRRTIYLAGKITGDPNYLDKFADAKWVLEAYNKDAVVLSSAILPREGFSYEAYIRMSRAMLDECVWVYFLPDWVDSDGAQAEYGRAVAKGKQVCLFTDIEESVRGPEAGEAGG